MSELKLQNTERAASHNHGRILENTENESEKCGTSQTGLDRYYRRAIPERQGIFHHQARMSQSKGWSQIGERPVFQSNLEDRIVAEEIDYSNLELPVNDFEEGANWEDPSVSEGMDDPDLETLIEHFKQTSQIDTNIVRYSVREEAENLINQVIKEDEQISFEPLELVAVLYATRWVDPEEYDIWNTLNEFASDEEVNTLTGSADDPISTLPELGAQVEEFLEWYPDLYEPDRERSNTEERIAKRYLKAFLNASLG